MKKIIQSFVVIGVLFSAGTPVYGKDPVIDSPENEFRLTGLVVDKTLTPPGRKFYREFARAWWELDLDIPENILVFERPNALRGSQISITINRKLMYVTALGPARNDIAKKALQAVGIVERRAKLILKAGIYSDNPDLGNDEL